MGDNLVSFLAGATEKLDERRRQNEDQSRLDREEQNSIFRWLLEHPKPSVQALGLAGLLNPPKKTLFGNLKDDGYGEIRALTERMKGRDESQAEQPGPGAPSPPPPPSAPASAAMPDVPPMTGGGGMTGLGIDPGGELGGGAAPPIDWPAGVPATGGGPPATPPAAAPAASAGPPPATPPALAAATVPQGAPSQGAPVESLAPFLQGMTPKEALAALQEADPDWMNPNLNRLRTTLQEAAGSGATMEDVIAQLFPTAVKEETKLTVAEGRQTGSNERARLTREAHSENLGKRLEAQKSLLEMRLEAMGSRPLGTLVPLMDEAGQVTGFYNNKTAQYQPSSGLPGGSRRAGLPAKLLERRESLRGMLDDVDQLEALTRAGGEGQAPGAARGAIGFWSGRGTDIQRGGALEFLGVEAPPDDVNDMFHIADNLADLVLRARSGAQINEKEFKRLRKLVPDPRATSSKFDSDLKIFKAELERALQSPDEWASWYKERIGEEAGAGGPPPEAPGGTRSRTTSSGLIVE